jgi:hypothetical protein
MKKTANIIIKHFQTQKNMLFFSVALAPKAGHVLLILEAL